MSGTPRDAPPLSPVLLAGFALRPMPRALLAPVANLALTVVSRRHADVMARLEALRDAEFLIDPVDLPFSFLLRLAAPSPVVEVVADDGEGTGRPTATVRAPLLALIDLAEGRIDGDALFFSRDLAIEGDTEAVLTLRNALDSGEIDLIGDVLSLLGPFARPARWPIKALGALFGRAASDLETLRAAAVGPLARRASLQANEISELEEQLEAVHRRVRRRRAGAA
jgi:predicted lipid carrier protein YhbT